MLFITRYGCFIVKHTERLILPGVEVLQGVWGPMVMLPVHRAVPELHDTTHPWKPHLSFKGKIFLVTSSKTAASGKKKKVENLKHVVQKYPENSEIPHVMVESQLLSAL